MPTIAVGGGGALSGSLTVPSIVMRSGATYDLTGTLTLMSADGTYGGFNQINGILIVDGALGNEGASISLSGDDQIKGTMTGGAIDLAGTDQISGHMTCSSLSLSGATTISGGQAQISGETILNSSCATLAIEAGGQVQTDCLEMSVAPADTDNDQSVSIDGSGSVLHVHDSVLLDSGGSLDVTDGGWYDGEATGMTQGYYNYLIHSSYDKHNVITV